MDIGLEAFLRPYEKPANSEGHFKPISWEDGDQDYKTAAGRPLAEDSILSAAFSVD